MTFQVLISTMYQDDYSLLDRMNIQSDAIVINQCDKNTLESFEWSGYAIIWICTTERGVGRSRNRGILAATADIILFADDDVVYQDNYGKEIVEYFKQNPKMAMAVFNLQSLNPDRPEIIVNSGHRLRLWNCLKFGAFRMAVRREQLLKNNIFFSLLFGGGARYQAGEDNLFITQFIQNGLRCQVSSIQIGTVAQETSTWFRGYNDQYFLDRGALFSALYRKKAYIMLILFELRKADRNMMKRLKLEFIGAKRFYCESVGKGI